MEKGSEVSGRSVTPVCALIVCEDSVEDVMWISGGHTVAEGV